MFAAFIAATGFLVPLDVGIAGQRDVQWWASAGQWIGGIGSIAAAAVALWIAQRGWDLAAKEGRMREAALFATWIEHGADGTPVACFANACALPVHDATATAHLSGTTFTMNLGTIPPTGGSSRAHQDFTDVLRRVVIDLAATKVSADVHHEMDVFEEPESALAIGNASRKLTQSIRIETTFRRGQYRWHLAQDGTLTQL